MLALSFVVLAALLAFSILANRAAAREVRGFMYRGGMTDSSLLAEDLADYYRRHGSWEGVAPLLSEPTPWRRMMGAVGLRAGGAGPGERMMAEMMAGVRLSDPDGRIIAGDLPRGRLLSTAD